MTCKYAGGANVCNLYFVTDAHIVILQARWHY